MLSGIWCALCTIILIVIRGWEIYKNQGKPWVPKETKSSNFNACTLRQGGLIFKTNAFVNAFYAKEQIVPDAAGK